MLSYTPYIHEMIRNICTDVTAQTDFTVHFEHGHGQEIIETLIAMTGDLTLQDQKYPLIALFHDYDEVHEKDPQKYEVTLHMVICSLTERTLNTDQRYIQNYYPVIFPVYEAFMKSLARSGYFITDEGQVPHTKTDRVNWGRTSLWGNEAGIFNDHVDALELTNLRLTVLNKNC